MLKGNISDDTEFGKKLEIATSSKVSQHNITNKENVISIGFIQKHFTKPSLTDFEFL